MLQIFYILNMLYLKYVLFHEGTSCTITNSYKIQLPVLLFLFVLHQLLHQQISLFFTSFHQLFFFWNMLYFNFLTVLLIQICKMQPPVLFSPFFYISFRISRYYFSQVFRTLFKIIWKKIFVTYFLLLTDCLKPSHPLNGQNPLTVTKRFR